MVINPKISELFKEFNIDHVQGMLCLLSIYHDLPLTNGLEKVFEETLHQLTATKIVDRDYKTGTITWAVPLYEGEENDWGWVLAEYRPLFSSINKVRAGSPSSCIKRMKELFKRKPEVRKDMVIDATKLYLASVTDPQYLISADYFIQKDKGANAISRLEQFIEIVKEEESKKSGYRMMK